MRSGHVMRTHPGESAVLVMLTLLAEQLGSRLDQPGATDADIRDTLQILEAVPPRPGSWLAQSNADSIGLLRSRLEKR